jgi:hypothetical protein
VSRLPLGQTKSAEPKPRANIFVRQEQPASCCKRARPCCRHTLSESFQPRLKLGALVEGVEWRAADRSCVPQCGHSSRRASGIGVAFVGELCRRTDNQGVAPRSLNPGKAQDRSNMGAAMKQPKGVAISVIRRHAADALRRARKLPIGQARNELRQLAICLLWLEKKGMTARVQDSLAARFSQKGSMHKLQR